MPGVGSKQRLFAVHRPGKYRSGVAERWSSLENQAGMHMPVYTPVPPPGLSPAAQGPGPWVVYASPLWLQLRRACAGVGPVPRGNLPR